MKKYSSSGFSLTELMIAVTLMSLVGVGLSTFLSNQNHAINELKFSMTMRRIAQDIELAATKPETIMTSVMSSPDNRPLKDCLTTPVLATASNPNPTSSVSCANTDPLAQVGINLYSKVGHKIAGTRQNPTYYSLRGKKDCNPKEVDCQLAAYAYFWATCPPASEGETGSASGNTLAGAMTSCPVAQTIHLRYQLVHVGSMNRDGQFLLINKVMPSIPDDFVFYSDPSTKTMSSFGAISIPVNLIPAQTNMEFSCKANETLTGIVNGKPVCECKSPFQEQPDGLGGTLCIRNEQRCGNKERFRGFDPCGNVLCTPVECRNVVSALSVNGISGICEKGEWMEKITLNEAGTEENGACTVETCDLDKNGGVCVATYQCSATFLCCKELSNKVVSKGVCKK